VPVSALVLGRAGHFSGWGVIMMGWSGNSDFSASRGVSPLIIQSHPLFSFLCNMAQDRPERRAQAPGAGGPWLGRQTSALGNQWRAEQNAEGNALASALDSRG
jgi:hypothetical protein